MTLSTGPKARLMLRYPDGQREQIALSAKSKLMVGIAFLYLFIYFECMNYSYMISAETFTVVKG